MTTTVVMQQFNDKVDINMSYSITDLKKILGEVYKDVMKAAKELEKAAKKPVGEDGEADKPVKARKPRTKRERDENGEIIKKRAPSAYNLFIKDQSAKIKADHPDLDSKVIFKMAIDEWKKLKEQQVEEPSEPSEPEQEANDKPVEPAEPEKPVTPAPTTPVSNDEPEAPVKPKKAARKPKKAAVAEDDE